MELTPEEYEVIKDIEYGDDVPMYIREGDNINFNPIYRVLEPYVDHANIYDAEEEIYNVRIQPITPKIDHEKRRQTN